MRSHFPLASVSCLALAALLTAGCSSGSRSGGAPSGSTAAGVTASTSATTTGSTGATGTTGSAAGGQGATTGSTGAGIAAGYPGDQNIASDPAVLFATSFENGIPNTLIQRRKGISVLTDPQTARTGSACAKITATRGVDTGGDLRFEMTNGVEECYVRFYCRFQRDTVTPHHFVNMSGVTPTYAYRWGGAAGLRPPGGANGAFSTTIEPPNLDGIQAQYSNNLAWGFYTYWHEMRSWQTMQGQATNNTNAYYGNNFRPGNQRPFVGREVWICVEIMVKLNTIGKRDGEQALWIDGKLIERYAPGTPSGTWVRDRFVSIPSTWNPSPRPFEGMSWRTHPSLKINRATLQWYVSDRAARNGRTNKNTIYFDNFVVATKYIGPIS